MQFRDMKIKSKFISMFSLIIIITIIAALWQIKNLYSIGKSAELVYKVRLLSMNYLLQADRDAYQSSIAISQAVNISTVGGGKREKIDGLMKSVDENYSQIGERFNKFMKLHLESGGIKLPEFQQFSDNYIPLGRYTDEIKKLIASGKSAEAHLIYQSDYYKVFSSTRDAMDKLTEVTEKIAEKNYNDIVSENRMSMILNVSIVIITILILIITGVYSTLSFTRPIDSMIHFSEKLKNRDMTARLDVDRKDEFGQLIGSLNQAAKSIDETLKIILEMSDMVFMAVNQINEGNADLSRRTSKQASSLEEIAATLEQDTSQINRIAENSKNARTLAEKGIKISDEGAEIAKTATASINELNISSSRIVDIITVINEIAFQTNLLALNAAVEAARAGEQGRGFAVVAGEVRNLAQRSGSAAKEIEALIKDSVAKVSSGTSLVIKTGDFLNSISESSRESARLISEVAVATEEQLLGTREINTAVNDLDRMTQQNAALVEEISSLSEEVLNRAKEMQDSVKLFTVSSGGI